MKDYETQNIRNVALMGHAGSGKTTLAESFLFQAGAINRRGTVDDQNTVSDFHELEHERGTSIFNTPLYAEFNNNKINIIDTPGFDDYIGEVASAIRVADVGLISVNAHSGIEVGTENGWDYCLRENKPVVFIVNKLDQEQLDFNQTVSDLKNRFGHTVTSFQYPVKTGTGFNSIIDVIAMKMYTFTPGEKKMEVADIPDEQKETADKMRNEFIESIAESDEELMNKYFDEGDLSEEDVNKGLKKAIIERQLFPLLCTASKGNIGTEPVMNFIVNVLPAPNEVPGPETVDGEEVQVDPAGKPALFVFKMFSESHTGEMTFFKVMSGKLKPGLDLMNEQSQNPERFSQLFVMNGKKREEVSELDAGDIGATVKLKSTQINHTLHEKNNPLNFKPIDYPNPKVRVAVEPVTKGEEEKIGMGLNALHTEDPTLIVEHSKELRQIILHAQGELHMSAAKWRLEKRFKVQAQYIEPRVPYRETIQKPARSSYRHKKQSGGAGQFAEVYMHIEPYVEDAPDPGDVNVRGRELIELDWGGHLEYVNCIVGGVIDQRFMPAILKGIMEKMQEGPLTGSYVRDVRVYVHDGKMHPVDSNEAAFKTAGMMVFRECFTNASPKLLEPIYNVSIRCPEEHVGDVMSDLPARRGVIQGIDAEGQYQTIKAKMPLAELDKYATALRSMTQARATFNSEFMGYETVPPNVQQELVENYKKKQEEEG